MTAKRTSRGGACDAAAVQAVGQMMTDDWRPDLADHWYNDDAWEWRNDAQPAEHCPQLQDPDHALDVTGADS